MYPWRYGRQLLAAANQSKHDADAAKNRLTDELRAMQQIATNERQRHTKIEVGYAQRPVLPTRLCMPFGLGALGQQPRAMPPWGVGHRR